MPSSTRIELDEALNQLEQAVHVPVVSGELLEWLRQSVDAITKVKDLLLHRVESEHQEIYSQIMDDDPELNQQVERLRHEDEEILTNANKVIALGEKLQHIGDGVGPHESQLAMAVDTLVEDGEKLFMRIRKQEVAISTWLQEALDRDRGTGD